MTLEELKTCPVTARVAWVGVGPVNGIVTINDRNRLEIVWDDGIEDRISWDWTDDDTDFYASQIIRIGGESVR